MKTNKSKLISNIWNYRHLISKIAVSDLKLKYKIYGLTEKFDGRILKNKPQMMAQSSSIPITTYEKAAPSRYRTRMTRIARIFTDMCASEQSAFHFIPSAFICVHLRLIFVSLSDRTRKIQFEPFPIQEKIEPVNNNQVNSCLQLLENKPQINADEHRFIVRYYDPNWLSCFSMTPTGSAKVT